MDKISLKSLSDNPSFERSDRCKNSSSYSESIFNEEIIEMTEITKVPTSCCNVLGYFQPRNPMTRLRTIKNLVVVSFSFVLYVTAYVGTSNLQSTMNSVGEIGVKSLIASNVGYLVSVMFLPLFLIKRFGCKLNFVGAILICSTYIAANFYPHLGTFIPTAFLSGMAGSTLWACNSTYLTKIGFLYASFVKEPAEIIIAKFFGIFYVFLESTQIWGSLISYYALKPEIVEKYVFTNKTLLSCGANFCSQMTSNDTNPNLEPPSDEKRYLMTAIFLSCSLCAALLIGLFLDPLDREQEDEGKKFSRVSDLFMTSLKQVRKRKQIFLLPITLYVGMQQGFYTTVYTQAFIACVWGVHHVGYVTICFGIVSSVTSCMLGPMVKCFSRAPVVLLAATGNTITSIYMLLWTPTADEPVVLFVIAGVWGFGDAIWWVLLDAAYGVLFENDEEAAFSNFYFWNSIGFILMFICSNYLCVPVTIYILLSCLFVGIVGYLTVEMKSFCGKKCQYDVDKGS